jgi:hypothetical protein
MDKCPKCKNDMSVEKSTFESNISPKKYGSTTLSSDFVATSGAPSIYENTYPINNSSEKYICKKCGYEICRIDFKKIEEILSKSTFANAGDGCEKNNYKNIIDKFPNSQEFWRLFVIPATERIYSSKSIKHRVEVCSDIKDIICLHYSIFVNLVCANKHLENQDICSFEDFYSHVGTVVDLVDKFLLNIYLLILKCNNQSYDPPKKHSKDEFLGEAVKWFDKKYDKYYEYYIANGKIGPQFIFRTASVLDEYFNKLTAWKRYSTFKDEIKQYRNYIVHNIRMGRIKEDPDTDCVPKKKKIKKYKRWSEIEAALADQKIRENDFVKKEEQMKQDFQDIKEKLNLLWEKPIADLNKLLYEEKNKKLLAEYSLQF